MTWIDPLSRHLYRTIDQQGPDMPMYHAVSPSKTRSGYPWALPIQQFRDQLNFLATEDYATLAMGELVGPLAKNWPADDRPAGQLLNAAELRGMQVCGSGKISSHTFKHVSCGRKR